MARSSALVCALLLVVVAFLAVATPRVESALTCEKVAAALTQCIGYIQGKAGPTPSAACCAGVRKLNSQAATTPDRQMACTCLKKFAGTIAGVQYSIVSGVPGKCGVSVPYAISPSTDCSRVK